MTSRSTLCRANHRRHPNLDAWGMEGDRARNLLSTVDLVLAEDRNQDKFLCFCQDSGPKEVGWTRPEKRTGPLGGIIGHEHKATPADCRRRRGRTLKTRRDR